jgi:nicotinamidase-related amidase
MAGIIKINRRWHEMKRDAADRAYWEVLEQQVELPCEQTALLLCDVWDKHWSKGATERVGEMVGRMNEVTHALRDRGATIVHAPSDTLEFYADNPARIRIEECEPVQPPAEIEREDPDLPFGAPDGGSDTGELESFKAWSSQHQGIDIDEERDGIADDGGEVYSFLASRDVSHLLIMGVHTNMCVIGRTFGIKQMVKWGLDVTLIRDLTDAMYNPATPPYVGHKEGTQLVVGYIEKFWCPSVASDYILNNIN